MKILHRKEFVLGTILLIAVGLCTAQTSVSRDAQSTDPPVNDLSLAELANQVGVIPTIGPLLKDLLNYVGQSLMVIRQLLNGIIARLLGGSLPCEVSIKNITCSGTSKEGGVFGIVEELIDQLVIPDVIKKMLLDLIKRTANPVVDTLFGGEPLPTKKV